VVRCTEPDVLQYPVSVLTAAALDYGCFMAIGLHDCDNPDLFVAVLSLMHHVTLDIRDVLQISDVSLNLVLPACGYWLTSWIAQRELNECSKWLHRVGKK
jgi:hypothetical protein